MKLCTHAILVLILIASAPCSRRSPASAKRQTPESVYYSVRQTDILDEPEDHAHVLSTLCKGSRLWHFEPDDSPDWLRSTGDSRSFVHRRDVVEANSNAKVIPIPVRFSHKLFQTIEILSKPDSAEGSHVTVRLSGPQINTILEYPNGWQATFDLSCVLDLNADGQDDLMFTTTNDQYVGLLLLLSSKDHYKLVSFLDRAKLAISEGDCSVYDSACSSWQFRPKTEDFCYSYRRSLGEKDSAYYRVNVTHGTLAFRSTANCMQ